MVVEPESCCWLSGRLIAHRDGQTWAEELRHYPALEYLVSDAGTALAKGVQLVRAERPQLRHNLDIFHTVREGNKALGRIYRKAAAALRKAERAQAELDQRNRQGQSRVGRIASTRNYWREAERRLDEAAAADEAWQACRATLAWVTPDGSLNDRRQAETALSKALEHLHGPRWDKTRRLLQRPETFSFLDRAHEQLQNLGLAESTLASLLRLEGFRRQPERLQGATPAAAAARGEVLVRIVQLTKAEPDWQSKAEQVRNVLRRTWRASSLVEGINSVARMQQARHRRMTQGLLDLKRFYWNMRRFRTGKRKKQTPYEILGLRLPPGNWWELLKLTPEQLTQELSAQKDAS